MNKEINADIFASVQPGNWKEPWRPEWDGYEDHEGNVTERAGYMGLQDWEHNEITCWEDEPSDKALAREIRIADCVNFCSGVEEKQMAWAGNLRDLIDAAHLLGSLVESGEEAGGTPAINWALSKVAGERAKRECNKSEVR